MSKFKNILFFILMLNLLGCASEETADRKKEEKKEKSNSGLGIEKVRIYAGQPGMVQKPIYEWKRGESKPTGIEPRLIEYILDQIGVEYEYVLNYPIDGYGDERIQSIMTDVADIAIQNITITDGRKDKVDFSVPYYSDGMGIMVASTSEFANLEDLKGEKVFAYRFSTTYKWAKENLKECEVISQEDVGLSKHPIDLIREGQIAAYLSDYSGLKREKTRNLDMRIFPRKYTEENFGIAVSKKHPELLKAIDEELEKMRESGRLQDFTSGFEK